VNNGGRNVDQAEGSPQVRIQCVQQAAELVRTKLRWSDDELRRQLSPAAIEVIARGDRAAFCSYEYLRELLAVLAGTASTRAEAREAIVACARGVAESAGPMLVGAAYGILVPAILAAKIPSIWTVHHRNCGTFQVVTDSSEEGRAVLLFAEYGESEHLATFARGWVEFLVSMTPGMHGSVRTLEGLAEGATAAETSFEISWSPSAQAPDWDDEETRGSSIDALLVLARISLGERVADMPPPCAVPGPVGLLFDRVTEFASTLGTEQEQSAAFRRELEEQLATIERQRAAIRDMATPVIEIWEKVLCLPLVGIMDAERSAETTDALLAAVAAKNARVTILDITGLAVMDTRTVDEFLRMAQAVKLLGGECVLAGVRPSIAQTMVALGVDLTGLTTYRSLRVALSKYMKRRRRPNASAAAAADATGTEGA
jgi:rsbT co-antagonist protein RsbR